VPFLEQQPALPVVQDEALEAVEDTFEAQHVERLVPSRSLQQRLVSGVPDQYSRSHQPPA